MQNKIVGYIIVGCSLIIGFMIWLFNRALSEIVNDSCSHGPMCPMWGSIRFHTNLSLGIMFAVLLLGLYFIFFAVDPERKVSSKNFKLNDVRKEDYTDILDKLDNQERIVFERLLDKKGTIFQSDLVNQDNSKVKVTRILDKLEGKGLIERKRRGMTNVVILKHEE